MSVLSIMTPREDRERLRKQQAATQQDEAPEPATLDTVTASFREAKDRVPFVQEQRLSRAYDPLLKAVSELNGKSSWAYLAPLQLLNPFDNDKTDYELLWQDIAEIRRRDPAALAGVSGSRGEFEAAVLSRQGQHEADAATAARGGFGARVVGGIGASVFDPVNMAASIATGGVSRGVGIVRGILYDGFANMAAEGLQTTANRRAAERLGEEVTLTDQAQNVALAGAFGGAFHVAGRAAPPAARYLADNIMGDVTRTIDAVVPLDMRLARALGKASPAELSDGDVAGAFRAAVPEHYWTPDEAAAVHVAERESKIDASSPFAVSHAGIGAHRDRLQASVDRMAGMEPRRPTARFGFDLARYMGRNRAAESGGSDAAAAETSSAFGRYQFLKQTWLSTYRATFGETGESPAAILRKRGDGAVQDRVMQTFTAANVRALQRAEVPVDDGTVYLAHFLGARDAIRVLKAEGDAPVGSVISAASIHANRAVFNKAGSASELVAWARGKMGGEAGDVAVPARFADDAGDVADRELAAALDAERADIEAQRQAVGGAARDGADDPLEGIELPQLRRELFEDEPSWRLAQAESDARALGLGEQEITLKAAEAAASGRKSSPEEISAQIARLIANDGRALYIAAPAEADIVMDRSRLLGVLGDPAKSQEIVDALGKARAADLRMAAALPDQLERLASVTEQDLQKLQAWRDLESEVYSALQTRVSKNAPTGLADRLAANLEAKGLPPLPKDLSVQNGAAVRAYMLQASDDPPAPTDRLQSQAETFDLDDGGVDLANPAVRFDDPAGAEARAQTAGLTHDLRLAADAGALDGLAFATREEGAETAKLTLARLAADDAALAAIRGCL